MLLDRNDSAIKNVSALADLIDDDGLMIDDDDGLMIDDDDGLMIDR